MLGQSRYLQLKDSYKSTGSTTCGNDKKNTGRATKKAIAGLNNNRRSTVGICTGGTDHLC